MGIGISQWLWRPIDFIGCHLMGRKFVGGRSVEEVLRRGSEFKKKGYAVTYNLLGEHVDNLLKVEQAVFTTLELLGSMNDENRGSISIKPTLYGLEISQNCFRLSSRKIVERAKDVGVEVEFDAEAYRFIPDTFRVYSEFASDFSFRGFVRQAVQAHLKDIVALMDHYALWDKHLRVVKGAGVYPESAGIVLDDLTDVIEQYYMILRRNGTEGQIPYAATVRDRNLASEITKMFPTPFAVEFEILYGLLGRGLGEKLLKEGRPVRIYIPFVADWCRDAWKPYGLRRAEMMRRLFFEELKSKFARKNG